MTAKRSYEPPKLTSEKVFLPALSGTSHPPPPRHGPPGPPGR